MIRIKCYIQWSFGPFLPAVYHSERNEHIFYRFMPYGFWSIFYIKQWQTIKEVGKKLIDLKLVKEESDVRLNVCQISNIQLNSNGNDCTKSPLLEDKTSNLFPLSISRKTTTDTQSNITLLEQVFSYQTQRCH